MELKVPWGMFSYKYKTRVVYRKNLTKKFNKKTNKKKWFTAKIIPVLYENIPLGTLYNP